MSKSLHAVFKWCSFFWNKWWNMKFVDWFRQNMRTGFLQFGEKSTNSKTTMTTQNFTTGCWNMVVQQRSLLLWLWGRGSSWGRNVALSKWLEPNVRLSVVSRAQEGREWNSLEGRGWHHSQLLVTPVGTSNDVPGDLERRSHHRKGLKICIFALPWLWAMSELVIIATVCRGMLMWTSNFVELWMDNSQSGLTWE